jgi:hypothetical protein
MRTACLLLLLTGFYPIVQAWRANRTTTLRPALLWAGAAWMAWVVLLIRAGDPLAAYFAVSLTACAGVAVLGARRPGLEAWNFVVAALLATLLIPIAGALLVWDAPGPSPTSWIFLGAVLLIGVLNYLPTRLAGGALLLGVASALVIWRMGFSGSAEPDGDVAILLLALAPWAALLGSLYEIATNAVDREWQAFRDRFGLVWGERQREQFNNAARNAGWPLILGWNGIRRNGDGPQPDETEVLSLLRAVLKRFGSGDVVR